MGDVGTCYVAVLAVGSGGVQGSEVSPVVIWFIISEYHASLLMMQHRRMPFHQPISLQS